MHEFIADTAAYQAWVTKNSENNGNIREKMGKNLLLALRQELTERQRFVFEQYYIYGKKIPAIAADLGLHKSTVARHLAAAGKRLRRIFQYSI